MIRATFDEIKKNIASYLDRVEAGETVVVTRAAQPVAEIRPVPHVRGALRPAGLCAGEFVVPAEFDDPLPGEWIDAFEGK